MVCGSLLLACLMLLLVGFIVCFVTLAMKAVSFSVRMLFGLFACPVKFKIRTLTPDRVSHRLSGIANRYPEKTSAVLRTSVKMLDGETDPTKLFSNMSLVHFLGRLSSTAAVVGDDWVLVSI